MPTLTKDPNNENLPEDQQRALLEVIRKVEEQDSYVRKQQIKRWKKAERFWHGIQYIYWAESQNDWITPVDMRFNGSSDVTREDDGPYYDYVINVFKGYGESIIAALGEKIPAARFPPDDADNDDDVCASKAKGRIADLIQRHNKSKLLLLSALLSLWNEGTVFAYHYPKTDKAFGMMKVPTYGPVNVCPSCGYQQDPTQPGSDEEESADDVNEDQNTCPQCASQGQQSPLEQQNVITGHEDAPKCRTMVEMYSPLFVNVSHYARAQKDFGYLILALDQPQAYLKDLFPHVADKIDSSQTEADQYEKVARSPSAYANTIYDESYLATLKRSWLRTWQFEVLGEGQREMIDTLKELYPDGAFVCTIGRDVYVESRNESLDKHWTVGKGGLSHYIHADALGEPQIPLQEMRNVLGNLTLETIEQGIATVYADPEVLNFDDFGKHEVRPGDTVPAKPKTGSKVADAFYEGPRAQLSKDVPAFRGQIDEDSEFVTGAFPSIYGGQIEGSSRTAAEYDMSRQMALQRLSICLALLYNWWAEWVSKAVDIYIENLVADEKFTVKDRDSYVNVWIRQSELTGKTGEVEAEAADSFPMTTAQKQNLLFKLIGMNNEMINAAVFSVENRKRLSDSLGFPDFQIPDENQRLKQSRETQLMVERGQFIPIEPDIDDDDIHIEWLKDYLAGPMGYDLKTTNMVAYQMNIQHLDMHVQRQQQQQAQQLMQQEQMNQSKVTPPRKGPVPDVSAPSDNTTSPTGPIQ